MKPIPDSSPPPPAQTPEVIYLPQQVVARRPAVPPVPSGKPDAIGLLKALRRRWPLALGLGLLCGAAVSTVAYLLVPPAKYMAQSMLVVASERPSILIQTGEAKVDFPTYQRTQEAMIRSRLVLNTALKQS